MESFAAQLHTLDTEAAQVLKVVSHFDALLESRAGLQSIVRAAAALAGCSARLVDPARRLTVRVLANGAATATTGARLAVGVGDGERRHHVAGTCRPRGHRRSRDPGPGRRHGA